LREAKKLKRERPFGIVSTMFKAIQSAYVSMRHPYPEKFRERIQKLKSLGESEIETVIEEILTKPQRFVGFSDKMLLSDAIALAKKEEQNFLEMEAPFLVFPRATPQQWNGNIDSIDTITGTYTIFTGDDSEKHNLRLKKFYKGGPQILPALKRVLGYEFNVTMKIDPLITPSSRFILVFPYA